MLRQCTEAGLVGGRRLLVDATHVEADAALRSLRAELSLVETDGDTVAEVSAEPVPRPALALAELGRGRRRNARRLTRRRSLGATRTPRCVTSPGIARIWCIARRSRPDPKARVIVAVQAETATGSEADALEALVGRARFAGHAVSEVVADAGYASQASYATLEQLKATALIPPQPGAKHAAAQAARARMRTPVGRDAAIDRQAHAEGAISELQHHGMRCSRCRGTRKTQLQLLAAATAINLKRLLNAQNAQADGHTGNNGAPPRRDHRPARPPHPLPHRDQPA